MQDPIQVTDYCQEFNGHRYYLCGSKYYSRLREDGRRVRLSREVWAAHNGLIPAKTHIHHLDGDTFNNSILNLSAKSSSAHLKDHWKVWGNDQETMDRRMKNWLEKAVPAQLAWRKSAEGVAWHSNRAKRNWDKRPYIEYTCEECGSKFVSRSNNTTNLARPRFCSGRCKQTARRARIRGAATGQQTVLCVVCNSPFQPKRRPGNYTTAPLYCSRKCSRQAARQKSRLNCPHGNPEALVDSRGDCSNPYLA